MQINLTVGIKNSKILVARKFNCNLIKDFRNEKLPKIRQHLCMLPDRNTVTGKALTELMETNGHMSRTARHI